MAAAIWGTRHTQLVISLDKLREATVKASVSPNRMPWL